MKRFIILVIVFCLILIGPSYLAYAGYDDQDGNFNIKTRLEVSKDNQNWVNYLAEDNSGSQTLTVYPGDTVYFRLKTWNEGQDEAGSITFNAQFEHQEYLTNAEMFSTDGGGLGNMDPDDVNGYWIEDDGWNSETGVATFTLSGVAGSSTIDSNYQAGGITSQIAAETPSQTTITATVTISDAVNPLLTWQNLLFPRANADELGTTEIRILVVDPPANNQPVVQTLPATGS